MVSRWYNNNIYVIWRKNALHGVTVGNLITRTLISETFEKLTDILTAPIADFQSFDEEERLRRMSIARAGGKQSFYCRDVKFG